MPRLNFFKSVFASGPRVSKFRGLFFSVSIFISCFSARGGDETPDVKGPNSCLILVSQSSPGVRQEVLPAPILHRLEGLVLNLDHQINILRRYTHIGSENQEDLVDEIMEDSSLAEDLVGSADRAAIEVLNAMREHPNSIDAVRWLNEVTDYFILKHTLWHVTGKRNDRLVGLSGGKIGQKKQSYPEIYITLIEILISQIERRGFDRELSRNQLVADLALFAMGRGIQKNERDYGIAVNNFLVRRFKAAQERAFILDGANSVSRMGQPNFLNFKELLLFGSKWIVAVHSELEAIQIENSIPDELERQETDRHESVANTLINYYFNPGHTTDQVLSEFMKFYFPKEEDLQLAMQNYWDFAVHFGIISSEDIALALVLNERGLIPELVRYKQK